VPVPVQAMLIFSETGFEMLAPLPRPRGSRLLNPSRWCAFLGLPGIAAFLLRRAATAHPEQADVSFLLGECELKRGRWPAAATAFERSLRRRPGDIEALGNLTLALVRMGAIERAGQTLRRLIERRPVDPEPRLLLGALLRRQRRTGEAIAAFREAARLHPMPTTRRFFLGETLLGSQEWTRLLATHGEAQPVASVAAAQTRRAAATRQRGLPSSAAKSRGIPPRGRSRIADHVAAAWLVAKGKTRLLLGRIDSTQRRPHEAIRAFREAFERRAGDQTPGRAGSALAHGGHPWR
jgi:tetratricopeptide (TPR) repeat protein